ncbi:hypothetical protein pb186bvf_010490 [Paramecium bursaria]
MLRRQKTHEEILIVLILILDQERYRDTINMFLKDNTLYDCLSQNNQLVMIDENFSIWDVFDIFTDQNLDDALFWNSDICHYDGIFTHTDLVKIVLYFYKCNDILLIQKASKTIDEMVLSLKTKTVKQWLYLVKDDTLYQSSSLVRSKSDEQLNETCHKMIDNSVNRTIVVDPEVQITLGTIQQKDIIVFLIKGFTQYFAKEKQQGISQHQLEIMHYYQGTFTKPYPIYYVIQSEPLHTCFEYMISRDKVSAMPIVNEQLQYVGSIHKRDLLFIMKNRQYQMLSQTVYEFYSYLNHQKSQIQAYQFLTEEIYTYQDTVKDVVEKLVLSSSGLLVCLNDDRTIKHIITVQILLEFLLNEQQ